MKYLTGKFLPGAGEVPSSLTFCYVLAAALVDGMLVAWSPLYFAVTVAHAGILCTAIAWAILGRPVHLSKAFWPVGLIAAWGLFQILLGTTRSPWLTRQGALTWFTCGVAFLLASSILSDQKGRHRFLSAILWATTALAIVALLQLYSQPVRVFGLFPAEPLTVGTFHYKNQFAAMLEMAAPIALYRMIEMEGQEWIGAGVFAILFGAAVGANSRAGVLLLVAELAIALAFAAKRRTLPWRNLLVLTGGLLVLLFFTSIVAGTQAIAEHFQEKGPYAVRRKLLFSTLEMVKERPILGYGIGTWPEVYPAFATFDSAQLANEAHNDWAQWAAEGGIPFALLLALLAIRLARPAARSIWAMGVPAVMIQSLVDYPTREPVLAIFWFLLAGALTRQEENKALPGAEEPAKQREHDAYQQAGR